MTDRNVEVAQTIVRQLGGALRMMGGKDLTATENGLKFKIMRNSSGITHIRITLTPADTYTVEFTKVRRSGFDYKVTPVATDEDIYAEQLHDCIERHTKLATRMPRVFIAAR